MKTRGTVENLAHHMISKHFIGGGGVRWGIGHEAIKDYLTLEIICDPQ
jgi:hypothetical protein